MSAPVQIQATTRQGSGKAYITQLRKNAKVPGVFYSKNTETINVELNELPLLKAFKQVGTSHLLNLEIDGKAHTTIIKELRFHPFKRQVEHVDFYGVDPDSPLRVRIAFVTEGKSIGEQRGGRLKVLCRDVEIECLPKDIPMISLQISLALILAIHFL